MSPSDDLYLEFGWVFGKSKPGTGSFGLGTPRFGRETTLEWEELPAKLATVPLKELTKECDTIVKMYNNAVKPDTCLPKTVVTPASSEQRGKLLITIMIHFHDLQVGNEMPL